MNDVVLTVGGRQLSGWTSVRITRRIEGCPNDFEIGFTEHYPAEPQAFVVQAGDPCTLAVDGDTVITGYVDRFARGYTAQDHTLSITGRGKTQDLVDCSAEWPGGQISKCTVLQIAQKLAQPYGISVKALTNPGAVVPQLNVITGETGWEIIERVCRWAGLLAYEDADGGLVLANTQSTQAANGFVEGDNVLAARVISAMDQRYSEIDCFLLSMFVLSDLASAQTPYSTAKDPNVSRRRALYLVAESGGQGQGVTAMRALWEVARRAGRGFQADVTVRGWRDSGGALWTPNTQAPLDLPTLKLTGKTWTLGEVTYRLDETGETTEIVAMDPSAFQPQPIQLLPIDDDLMPGAPPGPPG